jgi:hypothetical protein
MGHAAQAYAVVHVLKSLLNLDAKNAAGQPKYPTVIDQLERQAARIATNRVIAGMHFPVDSMAGRMLGVALGEYVVGRCTGGKKFKGRKFLAAAIDATPATDFNPFNTVTQSLSGGPFYSQSTGAIIAPSPLLKYYWLKAQEEWLGKFP